MKIEVKTGDILNERSDILICSANVYLNQSGGVGGEILRRYGDTMQQALREQLRSTGRQFVNQGDLIETPGFDTGFKCFCARIGPQFYEGNHGRAGHRIRAAGNPRIRSWVQWCHQPSLSAHRVDLRRSFNSGKRG